MLEQTTEYESGFTIRKQFDALENIAIKGEETKSGDIVLQKDNVLSGAIAVLATYGYTEVPVYNKPSVAIIATGSELLDVGDELEPGKIRNSNGPMISALAQNLGLTIETYKIQQDDLDTSIETVTNALQQTILLSLQVVYLLVTSIIYHKFINI